MTRQILFLIILILIISCSPRREENKAIENIRFDFKVGHMITFQEAIEINASLFNDNVDTAYFLSSSCDGEQYSLCYDTAKFVLKPFMNCNVSFPRLMKIAPKGQFDFKAHFTCRRDVNKIKLGFDFYSVDKSIDLTKITLSDVYDREEHETFIIWADEKTIK